MNLVLWILQILFGIYFIFTGIVHFTLPPTLPARISWMYELSPGLHAFSGAAEILGGLGLILPGLTRIQTRLTTLAALGLALVMIGAAAWHFSRGEMQNIVMNGFVGAVMAFVAYGRWKLSPLKGRK